MQKKNNLIYKYIWKNCKKNNRGRCCVNRAPVDEMIKLWTKCILILNWDLIPNPKYRISCGLRKLWRILLTLLQQTKWLNLRLIWKRKINELHFQIFAIIFSWHFLSSSVEEVCYCSEYIQQALLVLFSKMLCSVVCVNVKRAHTLVGGKTEQSEQRAIGLRGVKRVVGGQRRSREF